MIPPNFAPAREKEGYLEVWSNFGGMLRQDDTGAPKYSYAGLVHGCGGDALTELYYEYEFFSSMYVLIIFQQNRDKNRKCEPTSVKVSRCDAIRPRHMKPNSQEHFQT